MLTTFLASAEHVLQVAPAKSSPRGRLGGETLVDCILQRRKVRSGEGKLLPRGGAARERLHQGTPW